MNEGHIGIVFMAVGTFCTTFAGKISDGWVVDVIGAAGAACIATGTFLLGRESVLSATDIQATTRPL